MKIKKFVILLVSIFTLSACNQKVLRSDIAKFIENFSLTKAVEAYKEVEMTKVVTVNDLSKLTITEETISFNVKDVNNPIYNHTYYEKENGETVKTTIEYFLKENDKFYLVSNEVKSEITLESAHNIIQQFFYKETYLDGEYHSGGYYYGDVIKNSCYDYQNQITIDAENDLYRFSACTVDRSGGVNVDRCSEMVVDNLGMLIKNVASAKSQSDAREAKTEINIKKITSLEN